MGAAAHSSDAAVNHTTPMRKTRRRPKRSPAAPLSRTSDANVSEYPVMVHCRAPKVAPRSLPMAGRAMATIVASTAASAEPSTVANTTQRPAADR